MRFVNVTKGSLTHQNLNSWKMDENNNNNKEESTSISSDFTQRG